MSEDSLPIDFAAPIPDAVVIKDAPGAHLRAAREKLGLSVADVAQAIKFSTRQIEAFERDDFAALPSGVTFVRGFIRSYAKLLKIDSEPLLEMLREEVPAAEAELVKPENLGPRLPEPNEKRSWTPALLAVVVAAVAALGTHYFYRGEFPLSGRRVEVTRSEPVTLPQLVESTNHGVAPVAPAATESRDTAATAAAAMPSTALATPAMAQPAPVPVPAAVPVKSPGAVPAAPTVAASAAAPPVATGTHQLEFAFDDKSWVEVRDASRHIIFEQMNYAGSRQTVTGKPPFQLVIGNSSKVRLHYDGRPVDLAADTRAEVARMTLE